MGQVQPLAASPDSTNRAILSPLPAASAAPAIPTSFAPSGAPAEPVREIGPGLFQVGSVRINQEQRMIRVPAIVNMREGNLEYLLVASSGKTHESLLRTDVHPFQIQVAFLLLGARGTTNPLPLDPDLAIPGEPVDIFLTWPHRATNRQERIETFVTNRRSGAAALAGPWIFTGSRLRAGEFAAELDGSILSLITDPDCLLNNPRPGREDDDNWLARPGGLLLPVGAELEVLFRLRPR